MIEKYTPADVRRITGQELRVAPRITDEELAITGEIPLFPAVFHLVNGVLAGDTTYTQQFRGLQEWGTVFNRGLPDYQKIDVEDPAALLNAAERNRNETSLVDRLLTEHEQFGIEKRGLVREMRSETIAGLTVITDGVERIDEIGMVPLYVEEFQISALALLIRARRELDTGDALLGPVDNDTRLIIVTDTSESTTATHQEIAEGSEVLGGDLQPLDPKYLRPIPRSQLPDLEMFSELTAERILPGIKSYLPVLVNSQGWR